jgi:membrane protein
MQKVQYLLQFLKKDIWQTSNKYSGIQLFLIQQLKTILLAIHKYNQKHSRLQAASMTYYTALTLVPSLTLIYGLMKGFGLEETFKEELYYNLSAHQQLIEAVFNMAQSYVDRTKGTIFAGIGLALLMWGVFKTLTTVEESFNDIWGIEQEKPLLRKLSDYLTVVIICPLLIILSGSITIFVSTHLQTISENFHLGILASLISITLFFLPFMVIWLVFTFVYIFMPNIQINFTAGLWGGLIAGILYQVTQWCYIAFQSWINNANALYGSLAAIPFFLVWLQLSWMIVLFGSEISFAKQYLKTYEFEPEDIHPSPSLKKLAALLIMYRCIKDFEEGLKPRTVGQLAEHLHMPAGLVQEIISDLLELNLLCRIYLDDNKIFAYHPTHTTNDITVEGVLDAFEHLGQEDIPIQESEEFQKISHYLERHGKRPTLLKEL